MTLPAAGGIGALAAFIAHLGVVGVVIDAVAGAVVIGLMYIMSKRNQIGHDNAISDVDQAGEIVRIKRKKKRKATAKNGPNSRPQAVGRPPGSRGRPR